MREDLKAAISSFDAVIAGSSSSPKSQASDSSKGHSSLAGSATTAA